MVTTETQYAIQTVALTKTFPDWWGRPRVVAVDDLNLKVNNNEVYGLLGPNGSGKTTTLKMLLGLLHPSIGRSLLFGKTPGEPEVKSRIGYLPEESYLYQYLNARETLDFYGRIFSLPSRVRQTRTEALLEMVGLAGMANRPIGTYSKGMARRIGLAQALINDPDLLILDEPTSGMDPIGTRQMKDLILKLAQRGKTILLCSHLLADVEDVCDRIGILYGGKMQVEGQVRSLLQHKEERQIKTGHISEQALEKIREIIESDNSQCEIEYPIDRLEDYFIRIVTEAQKEKLPTSGALGKTEIGGFLDEEKTTSDVLDKLVSAPVQQTPAQQANVDTEKTEQAEAEPEPAENKDLLAELTDKEQGTSSTETVTETPQKPAEPEKPKQPDKNILDELTGKDITADGQTEIVEPEEPEEDKNE